MVDLDRESFAELLTDETTLVIGQLAVITYLETRREAHGQGGLVASTDWDFYYVKIQIQRQYFGPTIETPEIHVHDVRLQPVYPPGGFGWRPQRRYLADDLVLMQVRLLEDGTYEPLRMRHIEPDEIDRLARVRRLLDIDASDEQARQVLAGCFDPDPFYALWCLDVARDWQTDDPFDLRGEQYADIQKHISEKQLEDIRRKLYHAETTHPFVWVDLDKLFKRRQGPRSPYGDAAPSQSDDVRYAQHLKRISLLTAAKDNGAHAAYQSLELHYLFDPYTHKRTDQQWAEMVALLDRCYTKNPRHATISGMLRRVAIVFDPAHEQLRDTIFAFYKRHIPHEPVGDGELPGYGTALVYVMRADSDRTGSLCQPGLQLLVSDLVKADRRRGKIILECLDDYAQHCIFCDIQTKQLGQQLQDASVVVADDAMRTDMKEMLIRLELVPSPPKLSRF